VAVVDAVIVGCEVIAEAREYHNQENVAETAEPEMEATSDFAEEIHNLVEDYRLQGADLEISPFDLVSLNFEGCLSSGSAQWDFAGVELVNSLEQASYAAAFAETSLAAEYCSVMCAETVVPVLMEDRHEYQ